MESASKRIKELGGVNLTQLLATLLSGDMRPLEFDRLIISFGADKEALNTVMVLDYFCRCQSNEYKDYGNKYNGYWYRTDYQIITRTYLTLTAINRAISRLKDEGIVTISRKKSFKGQKRYRVEKANLKEFLKKTEEKYIDYLDGYDTRVASDLAARKEAILQEAKRLDLLNKKSNPFKWDVINTILNSEASEDNIEKLEEAGLSIIQIMVLNSITRAAKDYWNVSIEWNVYLFNTLMKKLSGSKLSDANNNSYGISGRDFQDYQIYTSTTCNCLVDTFKQELSLSDKAYIEGDKWLMPFTSNFNLLKGNNRYIPNLGDIDENERMDLFVATEENYWEQLRGGENA